MANVLTGLFKRIIKVRIEGPINQRLTDKITEGINSAKYYIPEAVVVVVNSPGGSLAQAKHISDMLKNYGQRKNVPIYCFAEDQCLGSANLILTTGVKTYANEMSLIGDFNYSWSSLWLKKFAEKYNVKVDYVYSGENKVKFNAFEDMKPESQKWMQDYLYLLEHDLKCSVVDNRQKVLSQKQMDKTKIEELLFSKSLIPPEEAVQNGFIDGIQNVDDLLSNFVDIAEHKFSGVRVYEVNKRKNPLQFVRRFMEKSLA